MIRPALVAAFCLGSLAVAAPIKVSNSDGFKKAVAAAKPGDTILLAAGEYASDFYFQGVHGTAQEPITIAAADPDKPPRLVGKKVPLQFSGASHLELRDLVIADSAGNGVNIDDADKPDKPSHHVTLRNIRVKNLGPKGNIDGIKLSGLDDFTVDGCTVEKWGSDGSAIDMVGCHRGRVVDCTFRNGGSNGVQVKGGSAEITVRGCRFEQAGERGVNVGGSTGEGSFRPRVKDLPEKAKYEAKDIRVEGCTFVGGGAAVAFVGVDGATVRYNTVYHPGRYALRILQENTTAGFVPTRNGVFERNVVVFRSDEWVTGGVNVGPGTAPDTFTFAANLWYCEDKPARSQPELPTAEKDGVVGKDPKLADPAKGDFAVAKDGPAADRGAHALPKEKK